MMDINIINGMDTINQVLSFCGHGEYPQPINGWTGVKILISQSI